MRLPFVFSAALLLSALPAAAASPIPILAAENFYGDIAQAIGGSDVTVKSVLSNPDQDPHLFEASPSVARALADAKIVIINGADYDPWVAKMLAANAASGRIVITVADLVAQAGRRQSSPLVRPGDDAGGGQGSLGETRRDRPDHKADYDRAARNGRSVAEGGRRQGGRDQRQICRRPVTATEPVFGYMAEALGLAMRNERFQLSVMNDTEPSARDTAAFENDLKQHKVKVLFYNSQVTDPQVDRLLALAREGNVPVVGVSETEPAGKSYAEWMLDQLDATEKALAGPSS